MENKKSEQVDNLMNLVEKHTRTERHLEQYSEIGDEGNKNRAREKQNIREQEMQNLKNKIIKKSESKQEQAENLIENYNKTQGYINNNLERITEEQLDNMENRQENRRSQMEDLSKGINKVEK